MKVSVRSKRTYLSRSFILAPTSDLCGDLVATNNVDRSNKKVLAQNNKVLMCSNYFHTFSICNVTFHNI